MGFVLNSKFEHAALRSGTAMQFRELPGVRHMAACVRVGLPEHAHLVTGRIGRFAEANGYSFAGPGRAENSLSPRQSRIEWTRLSLRCSFRWRSAPDKNAPRCTSEVVHHTRAQRARLDRMKMAILDAGGIFAGKSRCIKIINVAGIAVEQIENVDTDFPLLIETITRT